MPERGHERDPGVYRSTYGVTAEGEEVTAFELVAANGVSVEVLDYGGIVRALRVPDREGELANVVLGRPSLAAYQARNPYLGALVGRYANRIAGGTFEIDGVRYRLPLNQGPNHLHGGTRGFDKKVWRAEVANDRDGRVLTLAYASPDGEEGYPGTLSVTAKYTLTEDSTLRLTFEASTDAPTLVNLTNHSYFNLAGEGSGTVCDHLLAVHADAYLPVDETLIPTGEVAPVAGTPFDLRQGARIGSAVRSAHPQIEIARGIDHNFALYEWDRQRDGRVGDLRIAATLRDPASGRKLEVHTTEPGLQVYTGNVLDGTLVGTSGKRYRQGDAVALETQNFPDSPNEPSFPSPVLRPGETYRCVTELRFGVEG